MKFQRIPVIKPNFGRNSFDKKNYPKLGVIYYPQAIYKCVVYIKFIFVMPLFEQLSEGSCSTG